MSCPPGMVVIYQGPFFPWGYPLQYRPLLRVHRYNASPSLRLVYPLRRSALRGSVPAYDLFPRERAAREKPAAATPAPIPEGEGSRHNHRPILDGLDHLRRGEAARALGRFRDASLADLHDPDARYLLAHAVAARGEFGRSLAAFRAADEVAGREAPGRTAPDPTRVHGAEGLAGLRESVERATAADPALAPLLDYLHLGGISSR